MSRFPLSGNGNAPTVGQESILTRSGKADRMVVFKPAVNVNLGCGADNVTKHNAGGLAFGLDGMLYVGVGDGGCSLDKPNWAQNVTDPNAVNRRSLLGKILRIDTEGPLRLGASGYEIPADNPIWAPSTNRIEVWAAGLRHAWRLDVDPVLGSLYFGDVGEQAWEEINVQRTPTPGRNYGWGCKEGFIDTPGRLAADNAICAPASGRVLTPPDVVFEHRDCTVPVNYGRLGVVTSGVVYRAPTNAAWQGIFFYGDFADNECGAPGNTTSGGALYGMRSNAAGTGWESILFPSGPVDLRIRPRRVRQRRSLRLLRRRYLPFDES